MIEEKDFAEWLQHPVTKAMRAACAGRRADRRNEWEQNDPTAYTDQQFVLGNAASIGECRGLAFAEQFNYEQYLTEMEPANGEHVGSRTSGRSGPDSNV